MNSERSGYREHSPAPALRSYVSCLWSWGISRPSDGFAHPIIPDGCIDIIFDLADSGSQPGRVVGTMQTAQFFRPQGKVQLIAVRFRPGGAVPFFGFSAEEITDAEVELSCAWKDSCILDDQIQEEGSVVQKIRRLQQELLNRLPDVAAPDPRIETAVARLETGQARGVDDLAASLDISRQHVRRLFRRHVGLGPKTFERVLRVQSLLAGVGNVDSVNWSTAALDAGFYDQAHMAGECRKLTGLTPTQLVRI